MEKNPLFCVRLRTFILFMIRLYHFKNMITRVILMKKIWIISQA